MYSFTELPLIKLALDFLLDIYSARTPNEHVCCNEDECNMLRMHDGTAQSVITTRSRSPCRSVCVYTHS